MTDKPRNWQEDMNLCMKVDEAWSRELLIAEQPDITTYWLQQAKREKERADDWEAAAHHTQNALNQAASEITRLRGLLQNEGDTP
ncbi:hypothetical protein ACWA2B_00920 [Paenibacillus sp. CMM36]